MTGAEELRAHLAERYGFRAHTLFSFDQDVVLLRRADGPSWVARVFGPQRSTESVRGDAAILRWLEAEGYPAERCADPEPVSMLDGSPVLATLAVPAVPRNLRRHAIKDAGGIARLGELLAQLARLTTPSGAPQRPGGAWHHAADGRPASEIARASEWLEQAQADAPARELSRFEALYQELDALDAGEGLPQAFIHPDFVLPNVVATAAPSMVLVDWAGAGIGPRAWALAFLLWAEAAKDPRRAALALAGYRRHVALEPEEVERLAGMLRARPLIFDIWRLAHRGMTAAAAVENAADTRQLADALAAQVRSQLAQ
ncbi:MAG: phosphotransferase enzyme family protein [Solirubrobacteraceae bacterium]